MSFLPQRRVGRARRAAGLFDWYDSIRCRIAIIAWRGGHLFDIAGGMADFLTCPLVPP
jgi:hypothetical protein